MIPAYTAEKLQEQRARQYEKRAEQVHLARLALSDKPSIWSQVQAEVANAVNFLQAHSRNQASAKTETGTFSVQQKLQTQEVFPAAHPKG